MSRTRTDGAGEPERSPVPERTSTVPGARLGARGVRVSALPESAWQEAVDRTPGVVLTQTPRWLPCLEAATTWRGDGRLYELPGGRTLVLPIASRGLGRARVSASWPHGWGYGGVLASDGSVTASDREVVGADLAAHPGVRTTISPSPLPPGPEAPMSGAGGHSPQLTHVLGLAGGMDAVWRGYSANVRRSVKRAQREGVEVRCDTSTAPLADFVRLYELSAVRWARNAGRPEVLGRLQARLLERPSQLASLARSLDGDMLTWTAWVRGQAAAAVVVLQGEGHSLYWRGAQDQELAGPTHANALLHHLAIETAVTRGDAFYSFGESDPGSNLATYKAKFGAVAVDRSTSRYERLPVSRVTSGATRFYRFAGSLPQRVRKQGGDQGEGT